MQIFLTVLGYFFSISFFLFGILILFSSFLSGILIIFGSFLIFPKFTNQIRKFFWAKTGKYLPKLSLAISSFVLIFSSVLVFSNNSNQNVKKAEVLSVQSSQSQSSQFSRTDSLSNQESSQNSNSLLNSVTDTVLNSNSNSQNSTENSQKASQEIAVTVSVPVLTVLKSENNSQNLTKSQETQNLDKKLYDVLQVVDGDTIKISEIGTLRLIGIDTPETKDPRKVVQCFGKEASNKAVELLANKKVYLEFDKSKPILDKYQRTLAYVFREDGYFYNLEMVKDGFAHSYKQYPHPKLDEFNSAENSARNEKKGFWADNTCGGNTEQGTSGEITKKAVPPTGGTQTNQEIPKAEVQTEKTTGGFVAGSCAALKKLGLGNFRPGDPNYNLKRDGNGDGVACEM